MSLTARLIDRTIAIESGVPQRVQHLLKVYAFAQAIGQLSGLEAETQLTLECAAILHDIGIGACLAKYGHCNGPEQETEGPPIARGILEALSVDPARIERVCYLIAHHHTYAPIDGPDHQILIEADFLVNLYEGEQSEAAIRSVYEKIFRTEAGSRFCRNMFSLRDRQKT